MNQLTRRTVNHDLAPLLHAYTNQMAALDHIEQLTMGAIQGTSAFHQDIVEQTAETLDLIQVEIAQAQTQGRINGHKQLAITYRVNAYLYEMLSIMEETDRAVHGRVVNALTAGRRRTRKG